MSIWKIVTPIDESQLCKMYAGDSVLLSGIIYTARDAAHRRLTEALGNNHPLPFSIVGQTVYYMGPSPTKHGEIIGSCGPTTSSRMDIYTPSLLEAGLRAIIGKGERSPAVREALKKHRAVYLVTYGGAGALLKKTICKSETVAYPELGAEAVLRLEVKDFPAIVANDIHGNNLFSDQIGKYCSAQEGS
ncbi:MAG: FumA C-terminus/TtdB family hydratase beta subunit [Dehalococcoidia bacterium]|nr:FumA C-terminus/TtdB family hydratase beta subunit [Dehalococcoidia bacterium]